MGLFSKLTNSLLRASVKKIGLSSGSTFANGQLGTGHKNGVDAIVIMGSAHKEDYAFTKDDIAECKTLETNALVQFQGGTCAMSRYHVTFKDGKSAVLSIANQYIGTFESMIY